MRALRIIWLLDCLVIRMGAQVHHKREGGGSSDGDGGIYYPTPTNDVGLGVPQRNHDF